MISYTYLYGLFALTSILLFNALILLSRYVRQTKAPPQDPEFEALIQQNQGLQSQLEDRNQEIVELNSRIKSLEESNQKSEEDIKAKAAEIETLKQQIPTAPEASAAPPAAS